MQGTVLAPLKCSVSIHKIGEETIEDMSSELYKYSSLLLPMVDLFHFTFEIE